jgi:hypothetical protein
MEIESSTLVEKFLSFITDPVCPTHTAPRDSGLEGGHVVKHMRRRGEASQGEKVTQAGTSDNPWRLGAALGFGFDPTARLVKSSAPGERCIATHPSAASRDAA